VGKFQLIFAQFLTIGRGAKTMNEEYISPKGHSWDEVREQLLTPEERSASNWRRYDD
jgi:hypothetical protein